MKKVEEENKKVLVYEIIFYVVLSLVAWYGINGAINVYYEPSIVDEIKSSLIFVQIIGVLLSDIFLILDLKRNNNNMKNVIIYSIVNMIYFMFVFIVDGDPIFNPEFVTGEAFWWFDIFEWIDFVAIIGVYFYIAYINKLNNLSMAEEKIENKTEENVEKTKKTNKLILVALLILLVVSFIVFLDGDVLGIILFSISILAISIYGIVYMIKNL